MKQKQAPHRRHQAGDASTFYTALLESETKENLAVMVCVHRARVRQLAEQNGKLAKFTREILRELWDGAIDGGYVQDMADRCDLIEWTKYDPEVHGAEIEAEPGDEIYALAEWLREEKDEP